MLARRKKTHTSVVAKNPCSLCEKKNRPDRTKPALIHLHIPPERETNRFKYLITSVGSFSSVLYHPLAHLTAFGTPCCKLMTLGFLTPDPHLNRNQPRVRQRKHPTVGGFGHVLSPWQLYLQRWQEDREGERDLEREREGESERERARERFRPPPAALYCRLRLQKI